LEEKMNGTMKVIVGILIGGTLVCLVGGALTLGLLRSAGKTAVDLFEKDPAKVSAAASQIADFDLPDGYQEEYALDLAGITLVAYNPGDGRSHLTLAQGPKGLEIDQNSIENMLSQADPSRKEKTTGLTLIETRPVSIRGQQTTLMIQEGTNHEGKTYRQLTVAFQGKSGPALLIFEEPISRWNSATVDSLIESMR